MHIRSVVVCFDIFAYCAALFPIVIRQRRAYPASVSPSFRSGFVTVRTLMSLSVSSSFACSAFFSERTRNSSCDDALHFCSSAVHFFFASAYTLLCLSSLKDVAMRKRQRTAMIEYINASIIFFFIG